MTLGISMLKNIFFLHTKIWTHDTAISALQNTFPLRTDTQDYHPKHLKVLL